ncbi:MAG: hypothetical protein HKM89_00340, partial [Gemmatimonadales bacterium]|nr:hypothetical protein [Gemmatimonadales bacterium]
MTGRLVVAFAVFLGGAGEAQTGGSIPAAECRLPVTALIGPSKVKIPAGIETVSVTVVRDRTQLGAWRRSAGNRSAVAEIPLVPKLEFGKEHSLVITIKRRPSAPELGLLKSWLVRRAAATAPLVPATIDAHAERDLRPACGPWNLPLLDSLPSSL